MIPPRAYVFIGLNCVRILSIIALLLVFASSVVTMANDIKAVNKFVTAGKNGTDVSNNSDEYISNSTVPNQPAGAFWAVLNRLLIIAQVIFLFLSEIGWPSAFFNRFFPVLGKDFGTGALGVIECLLGAAILSHHVDFFNLFSAFFLFSIGCLNIFVGLVWRESTKSKRSVTSWREQAKNVLPTNVNIAGVTISTPPVASFNPFGNEKSGPLRTDSVTSAGSSQRGLGFGRQAEKAAGIQGYLISKPVESLPRYMAKTTPTGSTDATVV